MLPAKSVSAFVFDQTGQRVLMHLRGDVSRWSLPGSGVEDGESWETAAAREVREETGYEVVIDKLVGEYSRPDLGDAKRVYSARVVGGVPGGRPPETVRVGWLPIRRLPLNRVPGNRTYVGLAAIRQVSGTFGAHPVAASAHGDAHRVFVGGTR